MRRHFAHQAASQSRTDDPRAERFSYDRIADGYDERFTRYVREPQERLTRELGLVPGERVVDLGCGTGVHTVAMLERVTPGEVMAVDSSPAMLKLAVQRAEARSLQLTPWCASAEQVIEEAPNASFDVVSIRFCLAYLPWRDALPKLRRVLRPRGRVGILTNLTTSTPQAYAVYRQMLDDLEVSGIEPSVPSSIEDVAATLRQGGIETVRAFLHRFRIYFSSGLAAVEWMLESGYASHPELDRIDPMVIDQLSRVFGQELERRFTEPQGVPLDFEVAGIVAYWPG